jgi:hypothetical protein
MRRLSPCLLALLLSLGTASIAIAAQRPADMPAKLHLWGQFQPGAWKKVRVVTETLDEQGRVVSTSTTDTKTTLMEIDAEGVTLEVEACVEVAGKPFDAEPQIIKQGFYGDVASSNVVLKDPVDGFATVDDQKIPCKIQQVESVGPNAKTVTTIYYSTTAAPYVFRRESVVTDAEGKTSLETAMEVVALGVPCRVLNESKELRNGSHVKTMQKNAKGTVVTWAVLVSDVPGGVIQHASKEVDKNGRIVRRSVLNLVDYGTTSDQDRNPFKNKREMRRQKKMTAR